MKTWPGLKDDYHRKAIGNRKVAQDANAWARKLIQQREQDTSRPAPVQIKGKA